LFEEGEIGRIEAIGTGALPDQCAVSIAWIGHVHLKEIIRRTHFTANGDAIARNRTVRGPARNSPRPGTNLPSNRRAGQTAFANHEDQISLLPTNCQYVALPIIKSLINIGDSLDCSVASAGTRNSKNVIDFSGFIGPPKRGCAGI
jgi:hypothetical protein